MFESASLMMFLIPKESKQLSCSAVVVEGIILFFRICEASFRSKATSAAKALLTSSLESVHTFLPDHFQHDKTFLPNNATNIYHFTSNYLPDYIEWVFPLGWLQAFETFANYHFWSAGLNQWNEMDNCQQFCANSDFGARSNFSDFGARCNFACHPVKK